MEQAYNEENCEPIDWKKDKDEQIVAKINVRYEDAKDMVEFKSKQYAQAEAYLNGEPQKFDSKKPPALINHIFPIVRNISGLTTDVKPTPGTKLVKLHKGIPKEKIQIMLDTAEQLEQSLDDWWEDNNMQSELQSYVFSANTFADYYVMPFFNTNTDDADTHPIHPGLVRIDPNATAIDNAEYVTVDLYKSRLWITQKFGENAIKDNDISFFDYSEAKHLGVENEYSESESKKMKSIAHVILYMEPEWFAYKCGDHILQKFPNPTWATDKESQVNALMMDIEEKYKKEKGFVARTADKVVTGVKELFGMEAQTELEAKQKAATDTFTPVENYFKCPAIPLVQFETYRMAGQKYSISAMKLSIPTIDNLNKKKAALAVNADTLAEPTIYYNGAFMSEEDGKKLVKRSDKPIRIPGKANNRGIRDIVMEVQGQPLPPQFMNDMQDDKNMLDNLWGHHEVSKGAADPNNQTKGGIIALQEADQTPVRYLVRSLEGTLTKLFGWVVQIRKVNKKNVQAGSVEDQQFLDYANVNEHIQVFVKSGSMMPVSREQQRADAMEMFLKGAMDPLTLFERLNDPDPEKSAQRLQAWIANKQILGIDVEEQQKRVAERLQMILQNNFEAAAPQQDDDPRVFHDMLVMAVKQNLFKDQKQMEFVAQLIQQYAQAAGNPIPGTKQEQPTSPQLGAPPAAAPTA